MSNDGADPAGPPAERAAERQDFFFFCLFGALWLPSSLSVPVHLVVHAVGPRDQRLVHEHALDVDGLVQLESDKITVEYALVVEEAVLEPVLEDLETVLGRLLHRLDLGLLVLALVLVDRELLGASERRRGHLAPDRNRDRVRAAFVDDLAC